MRSTLWLLAGILLLSAIIVAAIARSYFEPPWVQVLGNGVLRSNAPETVLAGAESAVVDKHRHYIVGPDGKRSDPSVSERGQSWSTGTSPQRVTEKVMRSKIQITDKDGHHLSIERIEASHAPTLIFVEFDGSSGQLPIINEFLVELQKHGVDIQ